MIIGITGFKGSGKDTLADHLVEKHDFTHLAFADKLKEAIGNLFDMTIEQINEFKWSNIPDDEVMLTIHDRAGNEYASFDWRKLLQRFGTEMGRKTFGENFWVQQWENELYKQSLAKDRVVVPDVRFKNEVYAIQRLGGMIIRINRPGLQSDGHASEEELPEILIDFQFENSGTIQDLHDKFDTRVAPLLESK